MAVIRGDTGGTFQGFTEGLGDADPTWLDTQANIRRVYLDNEVTSFRTVSIGANTALPLINGFHFNDSYFTLATDRIQLGEGGVSDGFRGRFTNGSITFTDGFASFDRTADRFSTLDGELDATGSAYWEFDNINFLNNRGDVNGFGAVGPADVTALITNCTFNGINGTWFVNLESLNPAGQFSNVQFIGSVLNSPSNLRPLIGLSFDGTIRNPAAAGQAYTFRVNNFVGSDNVIDGRPVWGLLAESTFADGDYATGSNRHFDFFNGRTPATTFFSVNNRFANTQVFTSRNSTANSVTFANGWGFNPQFLNTDDPLRPAITDAVMTTNIVNSGNNRLVNVPSGNIDYTVLPNISQNFARFPASGDGFDGFWYFPVWQDITLGQNLKVATDRVIDENGAIDADQRFVVKAKSLSHLLNFSYQPAADPIAYDAANNAFTWTPSTIVEAGEDPLINEDTDTPAAYGPTSSVGNNLTLREFYARSKVFWYTNQDIDSLGLLQSGTTLDVDTDITNVSFNDTNNAHNGTSINIRNNADTTLMNLTTDAQLDTLSTARAGLAVRMPSNSMISINASNVLFRWDSGRTVEPLIANPNNDNRFTLNGCTFEFGDVTADDTYTIDDADLTNFEITRPLNNNAGVITLSLGVNVTNFESLLTANVPGVTVTPPPSTITLPEGRGHYLFVDTSDNSLGAVVRYDSTSDASVIQVPAGGPYNFFYKHDNDYTTNTAYRVFAATGLDIIDTSSTLVALPTHADILVGELDDSYIGITADSGTFTGSTGRASFSYDVDTNATPILTQQQAKDLLLRITDTPQYIQAFAAGGNQSEGILPLTSGTQVDTDQIEVFNDATQIVLRDVDTIGSNVLSRNLPTIAIQSFLPQAPAAGITESQVIAAIQPLVSGLATQATVDTIQSETDEIDGLLNILSTSVQDTAQAVTLVNARIGTPADGTDLVTDLNALATTANEIDSVVDTINTNTADVPTTLATISGNTANTNSIVGGVGPAVDRIESTVDTTQTMVTTTNTRVGSMANDRLLGIRPNTHLS